MRCTPQNPAQRRYLNRFLPAMFLYVACILLASYSIGHLHPNRAAAYGLAILPSLPILAMIVIVGLYLTEESDEFERTVVVQSMLWAIGGTLAFTTVWGFLEIFASVSHFAPYLVFPLFWFLVGVATPVIRRSYR